MRRRLAPFTRRITQRTVLRGLVTGFGLVVLLLGMTGLLAVSESRAIRRGVSGIVREQLLIARLLNEVQAEENTLTEVLHQITRKSQSLDKEALLQDLAVADDAVTRLASDAAATGKAEIWGRLVSSVRSFSSQARAALAGRDAVSEAGLESLFAKHDEVVALIHGLLRDSTAHLREADAQIEKQSRVLARQSALLLGSSLLMAVLCALGTILFVRHSLRRIEWQAEEINRVSWHMLQSQEETARRFSHELHDELGQSLAAVRANLTSKSHDTSGARNADCVQLVDEAIANVRELSQLLRPVILDDFGLDAGLRWLAEKFAQRTRLKVDCDSTCPGRFADETETHLFRIAQEALTNIARHAEATRVVIQLALEDKNIRLSVVDDGKGLPDEESKAAPSLGMVGMRARARQCGGELSVSPAPPHGLRIEAVVPLR
ncbi:MAG TPA: hypothetical protein DIT64_16310 [Verrucomicrobiales bacterium]|nr:hypothetical protein [Verrucomicrobiales bacterium]